MRIDVVVHGSLDRPDSIRHLSESTIMNESDVEVTANEILYYVLRKNSEGAREVVGIYDEGEGRAYGIVIASELAPFSVGETVNLSKNWMERSYVDTEGDKGIYVTKERPSLRDHDREHVGPAPSEA